MVRSIDRLASGGRCRAEPIGAQITQLPTGGDAICKEVGRCMLCGAGAVQA